MGLRSTTTTPFKPGTPAWAWLVLLGRWLLGAVFIYMGLTKAFHPEMFLKLVRQYDVTTNPLLLNAVAACLPWFEVFCGLLLLAGIAVRGTALVLLLLLVPFSILVLKRALAIATLQHLAFCAVKFDCGCGGGEVFICHKLTENAGLLLLSLWLIFTPRQLFCARFNLLPPPQRLGPEKLPPAEPPLT